MLGAFASRRPAADGLGRIPVAGRELEAFLELGGSGEKGPGILFCFHGFGESLKTRDNATLSRV